MRRLEERNKERGKESWRTVSLLKREKMRVSTSLRSLLFSPLPLFSLGSPRQDPSGKISPWLARVAGRPQLSGLGSSAAVPLHVESCLSRRCWSQRAAAGTVHAGNRFSLFFFFFPLNAPGICKCNVMLRRAALFIVRQSDPIMARWAVPAGCRWTHQAGGESKDRAD